MRLELDPAAPWVDLRWRMPVTVEAVELIDIDEPIPFLPVEVEAVERFIEVWAPVFPGEQS